jgi:prepilin-type processing-associated H-X9-DG protein
MVFLFWVEDHDGYMLCDGIPANYSGGGTYGPGKYWPGYTWNHTWIREGLIEATEDPKDNCIITCPSYGDVEERWVGSPTAWYVYNPHYGWNYGGLGFHNIPGGSWDYHFARYERVTSPAETIGFADSTYGYVIHGSWVGGWPNLRHDKQASVLWLDGHVTLEDIDTLTGDSEYYIWRGRKDVPYCTPWE